MRYVYINQNSMDALSAMLDQVQKRARVRLLTVNNILAAAAEAEQKLIGYKLPQRLRLDTQCIMAAPLMPKAYRYPSESTTATLVRKRNGWILKEVRRVSSWPVPYGGERVNIEVLTRPAHDYILRNGPHYWRVKELIANAYNEGKQAAQNQFRQQGMV